MRIQSEKCTKKYPQLPPFSERTNDNINFTTFSMIFVLGVMSTKASINGLSLMNLKKPERVSKPSSVVNNPKKSQFSWIE